MNNKVVCQYSIILRQDLIPFWVFLKFSYKPQMDITPRLLKHDERNGVLCEIP